MPRRRVWSPYCPIPVPGRSRPDPSPVQAAHRVAGAAPAARLEVFPLAGENHPADALPAAARHRAGAPAEMRSAAAAAVANRSAVAMRATPVCPIPTPADDPSPMPAVAPYPTTVAGPRHRPEAATLHRMQRPTTASTTG